MSQSDFSSNMSLELSLRSTEVNGNTGEDFGKRKLKFSHEVTDKRRRVDKKNTRRAKEQRRRSMEESRNNSIQDESQASCTFSPDAPLDAERCESYKETVDFIKTVCLKDRKPNSTFIPFQSQLMTSESDSQSSFHTPNFPRKEVIIEVPDPVEKSKYVKVRGEAKMIKFLKDCDLNPYVNLGERFLHAKEIQKVLYRDRCLMKFSKRKDEKNAKKGTYIEVKSEATKIRFLKHCDLNPYVNLNERVPHTREEIQVFLHKMLMKCSEVKNKKTTKNSEMKPKLSPIQKTCKTVDLEKFSTQTLFLSKKISNMAVLPKVPESRKVTMKKKRVTYQEKIGNLECSEGNFDLELSLNDLNDSFSSDDSKTLAELRESVRQNMKNEFEKSIKSKPPDICLKVGARKNFNQPLKPEMLASPVSQLRVSSNPDQKVTNTPATENCIDKILKEQDLFLAASHGNYHRIAKLLSLGVSVETENFKPEFLYPFEHGITPLQIAAENGHLKCVEILIHHGANVDAKNKFGCSALHLAAKNGNYPCLKMLLKAGADCRAVISHDFNGLQFSDGRGITTLHLAVIRNHEECAKKLIQFGANVNAVEEMGDTPLHFAVRYNALSCVKELLHAGFNVNCINDHGLSPLHTLCVYFQFYEVGAHETEMKILKYLVLKGYNTDINKTTSSGLTALSLAFQNRSFPVIKFLISCGADINLKENSLLEFLVSELIELDVNLNNLKYLAKYVLQLPRIKSLNLKFRRIDRPENVFDKGALRNDLVLPDNLKFQFFQTETEVYVETRNYEFIILPGDVQSILQQPILNLIYDCVVAELKYRDGYFHHNIWNCFSQFSTYQLSLLKKLLWYEQTASNPCTLQHYCRYYIRKCMGSTNLKHIRKLPLPKKLLSYLLFECDE